MPWWTSVHCYRQDHSANLFDQRCRGRLLSCDRLFAASTPSLCIVKNDSQTHARPGNDRADAVPHDDAVRTACADNGPLARREHDARSLRDGCGMPARLRARPLLHQQQLAAGVVDAESAQYEHHLQRKRELAVDVLVKTVVAAGAIGEKERGGTALPRLVALFQKRIERRRIVDG